MSHVSSFGGGGSSSDSVKTITGNSGGGVGPTANNINIVGSGGVTVTGNPGTSTLTITGGGGSVTLPDHSVALGTGAPGLSSVGPSATSGIPLIGQGASADPIFGTAVVAGGGTGATTLTNHGVLLGQGTSAVSATVVGTNGQLLVGATSADPSFITPTAGTGLSVTANATTLQYALSTPVSVANGGTGDTTLTSHGVLLGQGTSAISATAVGTSGQLLVGSTGADPAFITPTAGTGLSVTANATTLQYALSTPVSVANGGTGDTTITNHGVVLGQGTSALTTTAVGTNGQILVGATSADPSFITPTAGTGLSITSNATTLQYALSTPVSVANGGTGDTTLTNHGVLLGQGTSAVAATTAGTDGQLLVGATSANPSFVTPTAGTGLSITSNSTTLQYALSSPVSVANGGTGDTTLTNHGVLLGQGTSAVAATTAGTDGQLLIGATSANPAFITPTAGTGLSITSNATTLQYALSAPVSVANGGTGVTTMTTAYAPVLAGTTPTGALQVASTGLSTVGYVLTSNGASAAPSFQAPGVSSAVQTITGDTGGALSGSNINFVGGTTGLAFNGSGTTETLGGTLVVANGGTGATTLTNHGVVLGQGTSALTTSAVGTDGQLLIGATSANPSFITPTAGTGLSVTANSTTLQYALSTPVSVANGGTGDTTLTSHGVLLGQGTSAIGATAVGTNGQILVGSTGADPAFITPTAGSGLSITSNATTLQYALSSPVSVANGGTGDTTLTNHGVLLGQGTSAVAATTAGTDGQLLVGATSANPSFITPTAGTGLSITTNSTTLQYALSAPVSVANGGTGDTSVAAYSVVCGGTTSTGALQTVSGVGTSGQVLTSNGASALPTWQPAGSTVAYTNVNTSPYVVLSTDYYLSVDCSGGAITLQFPNAATLSRSYTIKDRTGSAATNNITITTVGGAVNIDGATTFVMNTAYQAVSILGNGSTYELW